MKNLFKLLDLTSEEIIDILDLADQLKYERQHNISHKILSGKKIGMIFEKSSTRTRVSFEVGISELGATPLFLSSADLQIGRGEPIQDTKHSSKPLTLSSCSFKCFCNVRHYKILNIPY